MSRSKKIFAAFAIAFFLMLAYIVYDISSRTTFPGSAPATESHEKPPEDSIPGNSVPEEDPLP